MTELDPFTRQPLTPGTPRYTHVTSEQDARVMWWQQQIERRAAAQREPDPAYDERLDGRWEPPHPEPVAAQLPRRRWRFNPRWVAWIAAGLALMWTAGVVIDAVGGKADPADPVKYAVGAAIVSAVAFLIPRPRDEGD